MAEKAVVELGELSNNPYEVGNDFEMADTVAVIPIVFNLTGVYMRMREGRLTFPSGRESVPKEGVDVAARQEMNHEAGYRGEDKFAISRAFTLKEMNETAKPIAVYVSLVGRGERMKSRKKIPVPQDEILHFVSWDEMQDPSQFCFPDQFVAAKLVRNEMSRYVIDLQIESNRRNLEKIKANRGE